MMCVYLLKPTASEHHGHLYRLSERAFSLLHNGYRKSLTWALKHPVLVILSLPVTLALSFLLVVLVPKGLFPMQDTGLIFGGLQGSQDSSFPAMRDSLLDVQRVIGQDPAVQTVAGFTGGNQGASNSGFIFVSLKPLVDRDASAAEVVNRLSTKLAKLPGASTFLQASQELGVGGRQSNAQYQYQLSGDTVTDLGTWGPLLYQEMRNMPQLRDVTTDQQNGGLQMLLNYDRRTAARFGITPQLIDNALNDQFGEARVSTEVARFV
jgi:multidrug efflux pump